MRGLSALSVIRESIEKYGEASVNNLDLLVAIVGDSGFTQEVAARMLTQAGNLTALRRWNVAEFMQFPGIGKAGAARLKAALELGVRTAHDCQWDRPQLRSPADIYAHLAPMMEHLEQEEMVVVALDAKNRVMATEMVYRGSASELCLRVGELLRPAVRCNAVAVVIAHNHPSGDPTPGPDDVNTTDLIVQGGKLLSIEVLDHIIIGNRRYISLKERGLGGL